MTKSPQKGNPMSTVIGDLMRIVGVDCLGSISFEKWTNSGLVQVADLTDFKQSLFRNHPIFFIESYDLKISLRSFSPFSINYMGAESNYRSGSWETSVHTDEEEIPHGLKISDLEVRRKEISKEINKAMAFLTDFSQIS